MRCVEPPNTILQAKKQHPYEKVKLGTLPLSIMIDKNSGNEDHHKNGKNEGGYRIKRMHPWILIYDLHNAIQ